MLLAIVSCNILQQEKYIRSQPIKSPPNVVWDAALEIVSSNYVLHRIDEKAMKFESEWREMLQPFVGEGYRTKVIGRVTDMKDGSYVVEVAVKKEINEDWTAPQSPESAVWKSAPDDEVEAAIIVQRILIRVEEELQRREEEYR